MGVGIGVAAQPILGPHPDNYTDWDRQQGQVGLIQAVKGGVNLTHREMRRTRDPNLGNNPYPVALQGQPPYALNPRDHIYDNHLLLPSLIPRDRFKGLFGFDAQDFYHIRSARGQNAHCAFCISAARAQNALCILHPCGPAQEIHPTAST